METIFNVGFGIVAVLVFSAFAIINYFKTPRS